MLDGVVELIARDAVPGGTRENLAEHALFATYDDSVDAALRIVLSDAQTSGGLLIALPPANVDGLLRDLATLGTVRVIGDVLADPPGTVVVR